MTKKHGEYLRRINKHAKIIAIEGFANIPFGDSLKWHWFSEFAQNGNYDLLMKEAVKSGFNGLFTEVDARDMSRIGVDNDSWPRIIFPDLPDDFF